MTPAEPLDALHDWLRAYHRTPRFFVHLLTYWGRRLLGMHCLVLVERAACADAGDGSTHMRCHRCGRQAWLSVQGATLEARVETGCPMTDRLAQINGQWMEEQEA